MNEFIQDYYITACFGILKWFLLLTNLVGAKNTWSLHGTIPIDAILFALERCIEYIRLQTILFVLYKCIMLCTKLVSSVQTHEDIDRKNCEDVPPSAWYQFLDWYYKIIYERVLLKESDKVDVNVCINIL